MSLQSDNSTLQPDQASKGEEQDRLVETSLNAPVVAKLSEVALLEEENKRLRQECDRLLAQLARTRSSIAAR